MGTPTNGCMMKNEISIVGLGCRTAGADNAQEFWRLMVNGECHVTEVPRDRWNIDAYLDENDTMAYGKAYVQKGAFIKDLYWFDNGVYGINDLEASKMDPQQCLLLDCTMMALQDAGLTRAQIQGSNTGVFIGSMSIDSSAAFVGLNSKVDSYTLTNTGTTMIANRVSHVFDLRGPSIVVDNACSSSVTAIHLGCQALLAGDCDMAICGGVNILTLPDIFVQLSKARMLSPTGLCQAFSEKADGYVRGEGCGIIVLKRLKDAEEAGDQVRATIYTGISQNGRVHKQISYPSREEQKKLLEAVYKKFSVTVSDVDYIEAHGTGTPAGDVVEVNALGSFFGQQAPRNRYIGSVKTNIGHTEGAAGILGIIKILLMMEHGKIVPSLHCDKVNPKIDMSAAQFVIPKAVIPWLESSKTAACNSFGFGGSNSHAIVKSFKGHFTKTKISVTNGQGDLLTEHSSEKTSFFGAAANTKCMVCFSGKTFKSLTESMKDLHEDAEALKQNVHDVAYTSSVCRDHYPYRAAFLVHDMEDLTEQIDNLLIDLKGHKTPRNPEVVYVISGMVPLWNGVCRELMSQNAIFRAALQEVEKYLLCYESLSLTEKMMHEDLSKDPLLHPVAIFACQIGLIAVWRSMGMEPSCVVGQSIGEVAAAVAAGCLSLADAVKIIYHRSRLLAQANGGFMLIVQNYEVEAVRRLLGSMPAAKATIAVEYSPVSCAVSMDIHTLSIVECQLKAKGIAYKMLNLPAAYHSHFVDPYLKEFEECILDISPSPPKIRFVSTVTGCQIQSAPGVLHWKRNLRDPVLFGQAITAVSKSETIEDTVFLEIGPRQILQAHLKQLFPGSNISSIQSMKQASEMNTFLEAAKILYERGLQINFENIPTGGHLTNMPRYIFDRRNIREKTETDIILQNGVDFSRKNHLFVLPIRDSCTDFVLLISPLSCPSVYDHVVSNTIIVPGAFYAEAAFGVAQYIHFSRTVSVAADFIHPASVKKNEVTTFSCSVEETAHNGQNVQTTLGVLKDGHDIARLKITTEQSPPQQKVNIALIQSQCTQKMGKEDIYSALQAAGFNYRDTFRQLESAGRNGSECIAEIRLHETVKKEMQTTRIHPNILDCMMQSSAIVMHDRSNMGKKFLPKSIGRLFLHGTMEPTMYVHTCLKTQDSEFFVVDQYLLSRTGIIISELNDLKLQLLERQNWIPKMIRTEWQMVKEMQSGDVLKSQTEPHKDSTIILITDTSSLRDSPDCLIICYENCLDEANFYQEVADALKSATSLKDVCLVYSEHTTAEMDGVKLQSRVIFLSILIQRIFETLIDCASKASFCLYTTHAWPAPNELDASCEVNPNATALWGLLRSAVVECVYSRIKAVDLHIPLRELTLDWLIALNEMLETDHELQGCIEVIATEHALFRNFVVEAQNISVPRSRNKQVLHTDDHIPSDAIFLCRQGASMSDVIATFPNGLPRCDENCVRKLKLHTFVQPAPNLVTLKAISSNYALYGEKISNEYQVVMALEVAGHIVGDSEEVIACCPTTIGPEITVKTGCTVSSVLIPDYQPGDLIVLAFLYQLSENIMTENVTILASEQTQHLATCLKFLCSAKTTHTVTIENWSVASQDFNETVVSLVLLDDNVMSLLKRYWKTPMCLVACTTMVTPEVHSFLSCKMPDVEVHLQDSQMTFQSPSLLKILPKLKNWMIGNPEVLKKMAELLHSASKKSSPSDISALLKFNVVKMNDLSVQNLETFLFRKDSSYVVVGGLSGLGWLCVNFLAENQAGYIAIMNRSSPSDERRRDITNLSQKNQCQIEAFQTDITNIQSLKETFEKIQRVSKNSLRGVFTGAVVIDDAAFHKLTRSAFERGMSPKVLGTWNLHVLTKDLPLDYFVMHSSVISVVGSLGQANYSAACAFQDGMAYYRRHHSLVAQTINWGPTDMGLMENNDAARKFLVSVGYRIATESEIRNALKATLQLNWTQTTPADSDLGLLGERLQTSRFKKNVTVLTSTPNSRGDADARNIRFMDTDERLSAYERYVADLTGRLLNQDHSHDLPSNNLYELGLDSVTGSMMTNLIYQDTNFRIDAMSIFTAEATVASVAMAIEECARAVDLLQPGILYL